MSFGMQKELQKLKNNYYFIFIIKITLMKTIQEIKCISDMMAVELIEKWYNVPDFDVLDIDDINNIILWRYSEWKYSLIISLDKYLEWIAEANRFIIMPKGESFESIELWHTIKHEIAHFILWHSKLKAEILEDIRIMQAVFMTQYSEECSVYFREFDWLMVELWVENILFQDFKDEYIKHLCTFSETTINALWTKVWIQKYSYLKLADKYWIITDKHNEIRSFIKKFEKIFFWYWRTEEFKILNKDMDFEWKEKSINMLLKIVEKVNEDMNWHIEKELITKWSIYSKELLNNYLPVYLNVIR